MRLHRNHINLKRDEGLSRSHRGPFQVLSKTWGALMLSLAADPLFAVLGQPSLLPSVSTTITIFCAIITLPFIDQARVCRGVSKLRTIDKKNLANPSSLARAAFLLTILSLLLAKFTALPRVDTVVGFIFGAILVFAVFKSIKHATAQGKLDQKRALESPDIHVELWESQLIRILLFPMLTARGVSLSAALGDTTENWKLLCLIVSVLLLAMMRPRQRLFVGCCARCKHPVPIVFVEYQSCPRCDERFGQQPGEFS